MTTGRPQQYEECLPERRDECEVRKQDNMPQWLWWSVREEKPKVWAPAWGAQWSSMEEAGRRRRKLWKTHNWTGSSGAFCSCVVRGRSFTPNGTQRGLAVDAKQCRSWTLGRRHSVQRSPANDRRRWRCPADFYPLADPSVGLLFFMRSDFPHATRWTRSIWSHFA